MLSKKEIYARQNLRRRQQYRTDDVYREIKRCRHIIWHYKQPLPEGKRRYYKDATKRKENVELAQKRLDYLLPLYKQARKEQREEAKRQKHEQDKNKDS